MKSRPIVLVNEGCAMSSFIIRTLGKILRTTGYEVNSLPNNKTEVYKPKKNPYYEDGMDTYQLLKKTFSKVDNLLMKLSFRNLHDSNIMSLLKDTQARVCFVQRYNLLDIAVCKSKDFSDISLSYRKKHNNFHDWRHSLDRLYTKSGGDLVFSLLKKEQKKMNKKKELMRAFSENQTEFICAYKLCDLCFDEFYKMFEILGFKIDKQIFNEKFGHGSAKEQYKHTDVIIEEDIDGLKEKLKKHNFLKYWRGEK